MRLVTQPLFANPSPLPGTGGSLQLGWVGGGGD